MVINAANVRSTIYIINIYNILSVCVRGCMKAGKTFAELGTKKRFPILSSYLFFWYCYPSLSAVLCKYLCNYALYL